MTTPLADRARAAQVLHAVIEQRRTTDQAFGSSDPSPLCQELVYGALRHYFSLSDAIDGMLDRPLRSKDRDLRCLMLVGAYQLQYTRIPDHAAINETVAACRQLHKPWARALLNAVLRRFAQSRHDRATERSFELPLWIEERLRSTYGTHSGTLLEGLLERAPMSLRINLSRTSVPAYCERLDAESIAWLRGYPEENLVLAQPCPSQNLPGYPEGHVSIQDSGALIAAPLLAAEHPQRVLDACAAPGGKLFHLCERLPAADVVGLEINPQRFDHLVAEAQRLGHTRVRLLEADAESDAWWDGRPFDAVLVDAPCSGSGTLRRHPEIKLLRSEQDLARYQQQQLRLLRNLWRTVSPGGTLLYCTCSLFQEENDNVVRNFLAEAPAAVIQPIEAPRGIPTTYGWQLLPTASDPTSPDGFYYARLRKAGS